MSNHWDEFSKSLAEPLPRRESLRRLGFALTATVLGPLGSQFAWAGRQDPCKAFCRCRNNKQKEQCLRTCKACNKDVSRLAGSCGNYVCCGEGQTSCGSYCADLGSDPDNCGACGNVCAEPGPYEYGTCIFGQCEYACYEGAVYCDGLCTFLDSDPLNCGACGNVCPESAPYCSLGVCVSGECSPGLTRCGASCVDLSSDPENCGTCGNLCGGATPYCNQGVCSECAWPYTLCDGVCINTFFDSLNCGGCGVQCGPQEVCNFGRCEQSSGGF